MADLYPSSYNSHRQQSSYHRHPDPLPSQQQQQQQQQQQYSQVAYNSQPVSTSGHSSSSNGSSEELHDPPMVKSQDSQPPQKSESKPQATFLTKLYALLERPENHHMIRWDPAGEHIIVERPEQLALHVLPSIYRQSRFASFSRQLNIYGFMRKVNLRNVDPAIDDPDASTWSHPTLNRHSPPEVVANFKRRVPPRLPKPRKRDGQDLVSVSIPPPRSAIGMSGMPLPIPSSVAHHKSGAGMRARGFSAPGSFTPLSQGGAAGWNTSYPARSPLPPLTVPSDPLPHPNIYHQSHHTLHPVTPTDDSPTSPAYHSMPYSSNSNRDNMMVNSSSQYHYTDQGHWQFSPVSNGSSSSHSGSLSSLLNPSSSGYSSRPTPTINTSYASPFASMPIHNDHNASSLSPDSRPTTGYSMSSVSSLPYEDHNSSHHLGHDYGSRPNSSHHRGNSPTRPVSSKSSYHNSNSLSVRRQRRHSQAMSPYPSPYDHTEQHHRPSSSPHPSEDPHGNITRVRSMIQLPTVDPYSFNPGHAEFAYSAGPIGTTSSVESIDGNSGWNHPGSRSGRPSTSTSSISAASHASSSQANTPDHYGNGGDTDINRSSIAHNSIY